MKSFYIFGKLLCKKQITYLINVNSLYRSDNGICKYSYAQHMPVTQAITRKYRSSPSRRVRTQGGKCMHKKIRSNFERIFKSYFVEIIQQLLQIQLRIRYRCRNRFLL